jgi:hypothetical protein
VAAAEAARPAMVPPVAMMCTFAFRFIVFQPLQKIKYKVTNGFTSVLLYHMPT